MQIISSIAEIQRLTRRKQRAKVIEALVEMGFKADVDYRINHDGWPVILLHDVSEVPSKSKRPNFDALGR